MPKKPSGLILLAAALCAGCAVTTTNPTISLRYEKGLDSKVVLSRVDASGRPMHQLTPAIQNEIGGYFARYKSLGRDTWSKVPGWGTAEQGLAFVTITHAFFQQCATRTGPCSIELATR